MARLGGRRSQPLLPLLYLAAGVVAAVVVLPTALRPPPEQQQSSSALSPDAPPDDQPDTILQSLQQAASRTAGATGGRQQAAPATTTTTVVRPSRGRCFGNPPRQTESAYSPYCRAAFTGDNGGATYKNVTGDEVRVAYWATLGMPNPAERGPVSDSPRPNESAAYRTSRIIQQYINQRYELYGRKLQLVALAQDGQGPAEQRTSAIDAEHAGAFASTAVFYDFCDELTRRGLVCFNVNGFKHDGYLTRQPLFWSYQAEFDYVDRWIGEYACKKLVGRNADFAGTGLHGKPRKIGLLVESYPGNGFRKAAPIKRAIEDQCGGTVDLSAEVTTDDVPQLASTMAQLKSRGVTTVIMESEIPAVITAMSQSDSSAYFPEWVMVNSYGLDTSGGARLLPATQRAHLFGGSGWELPRPFADSDCYRAYKTIDPTGTADQDWCSFHWIPLEHIVNGIQEAGPHLTPETFRDGMFSMPLGTPREPYAITGEYGPNNYSFVKSFSEFWWDDSATDPNGGAPGALRYTAGGRRWRLGELDDVERVFTEGVRGYDAP